MGKNNMRFYRKKAGLTQDQLAKKLKKSKSWVSLKENGQRKVTTEDADLIANAIGTPVKKIFFA
jgi:transcriptional regulator with XRE-family HTH domain